ncbi:MAG: bifunctional oligoribonuclease/PAP phosphatase NrnA [Oscillospiraceae bacterium]|jgi:phosphoesterase RecJ-like protein|nr:bifunctional oligoribonuclease/PAP phosphatase NrnA [Oscillospiraceae bacterium]
MKNMNTELTAEWLLSNDDYLILCHRYPDGDTIGSAFALCRALIALGKNAAVICSDLIPSKYAYIYDNLNLPVFKEKNIIAVDVADPKLLGMLEEEYGGKVDLCIDHHGSNLKYAKRLLLDPKAAATGEIIYRLIPAMGVSIDKKMAEALFTAIVTDTGCFRYGNTTPETMRIGAELMSMGVDHEAINREMFDTKSRERMAVEQAVLSTLDYWCGGKCAVMYLTDEMIQKTNANEGDLEGLAPMPKRIEGVKIGITLRQGDEGYKVSVRTNPGIDACQICKKFGGGGHTAASGCFIKGTLSSVKEDLHIAISEVLGE